MKIWFIVLGCFLSLIATTVNAEVSQIEITSRQLIANGQDFGNTGQYEEIIGRITFEIDPDNPHNQIINDIALAPRNGNGMVEMTADLEILAPVNPENSNKIALIDIVNRGRKIALNFNQPSPTNAYGDGYLMTEGYTIVWIGWEFDISAGVHLDVPSILEIENSALSALGFAAVRDTASWLKYSSDAIISSEYALTFGLSQSGRFLRNYLYLGFNTDEYERKVFDGVMPHIAGSSRIDLNRRGAEPVSQGQFTATSYPFADQALLDPVTGISEGMLENPRTAPNQPLIFYTNTSVEYWGGGRIAAMVHTSPDGLQDLELPDNVRFYFLAGSQHGPGAFPPGPATTGQQMGNPMNYWWPMRALLSAMSNWILDDIEPPPSSHPSLATNTLVPPSASLFPSLINVHSPIAVTTGTRIANPLLSENGGEGAPLTILVPQVDSDGNETSGIRHPELSVPLATYTGWNFTNPNGGDPDQLFPLAGSYIPFAATRQQRIETNDPRPSISERYSSKTTFLEQTQNAGETLITQRYLLQRDLSPILQRASQHWDLLMSNQ